MILVFCCFENNLSLLLSVICCLEYILKCVIVSKEFEFVSSNLYYEFRSIVLVWDDGLLKLAGHIRLTLTEFSMLTINAQIKETQYCELRTKR